MSYRNLWLQVNRKRAIAWRKANTNHLIGKEWRHGSGTASVDCGVPVCEHWTDATIGSLIRIDIDSAHRFHDSRINRCGDCEKMQLMNTRLNALYNQALLRMPAPMLSET